MSTWTGAPVIDPLIHGMLDSRMPVDILDTIGKREAVAKAVSGTALVKTSQIHVGPDCPHRRRNNVYTLSLVVPVPFSVKSFLLELIHGHDRVLVVLFHAPFTF